MPEDFDKREDGTPIVGVRWTIRTRDATGPGNHTEDHECYQYKSVAEVLRLVLELQTIPGYEALCIMTHQGQYENLRPVWKWKFIGPERVFEHYGDVAVQIPDGYFRVFTGRLYYGDLTWNLVSSQWMPPNSHHLGRPFNPNVLVIRTIDPDVLRRFAVTPKNRIEDKAVWTLNRVASNDNMEFSNTIVVGNADQAHVMRCINSFEPLVAALKSCMHRLYSHDPQSVPECEQGEAALKIAGHELKPTDPYCERK